jgi:hypothetical protein
MMTWMREDRRDRGEVVARTVPMQQIIDGSIV